MVVVVVGDERRGGGGDVEGNLGIGGKWVTGANTKNKLNQKKNFEPCEILVEG